MTPIIGATSLFTTVGDLLAWEGNFARPVVGTAPMFKEMMARATVANGDTTAYGLGIATELYRGTWVIGHGGADAGYRSWSGRATEHGLAVVVLCNGSTANPTGLALAVIDVLVGARLAAVPPHARATTTLTAEQLAPFAGVYANPVTGGPMFITLRRDTLVVGRINGPALLPVGPNRFRLAGQPGELEFTDGAVTQTFAGWPARAPVTAKRVASAVPRPSRADLEKYAGSYYSEELGATYTVSATDSTLVLKTRGGTERNVRPVYGDTFAGDFLLSFVRGRGGRVERMLMGSGRVRGVRFDRLPDGASR